MPRPSQALYDFAILTSADVDLALLPVALEELMARAAPHTPVVELFGRADAGEIIVLFRFPFAAYSAALRQKMERQAQRLRGRLVETELLGSTDRERFYSERLASCEVRVDATDRVGEAVQAFRARMRLEPGGGVYQLRFSSTDDIAAAWARSLAEGGLFVPAPRLPEKGATVSLLLCAPGAAPFEASGHVLDVTEGARPGFFALLAPGDALREFLGRHAMAAKSGRRKAATGRRRHPRVDACLEVAFEGYPELSGEYATNISRGGIFVRTTNPPALRSRVRLRLSLPDAGVAETDAEVVHVVTEEQARAGHGSPGVGLSFAGAAPAFFATIEQYLDRVPERRPRVLVVDDDRFFREVLGDALAEAKLEVDTAADGKQALEVLSARLFEIDAVVLDLQMPDLDGYCLIDRIRRLGGEMDLRIVVLSAASDEELAELKGPDGVDDAIRKGTSLAEIVRRLERVLAA